jgi:elongation factor P hydroxylase
MKSAGKPTMSSAAHDASRLIALFADIFAASHRTRLVAGGDEPFYRPARHDGGWNEIIFRHDYFQSALHEIAHWCVAGDARRRLPDYGYWYDPDGRSGAQQARFEQVEARPQAVEWVLTAACGKRFRISADNLESTDPVNEAAFWRAVHREVQCCLAGRLPPRAAQFAQVLAREFGQPWPLPRDQFVLPPDACGGANSTV